jgi:hypothetical protein
LQNQASKLILLLPRGPNKSKNLQTMMSLSTEQQIIEFNSQNVSFSVGFMNRVVGAKQSAKTANNIHESF